jgi:hypothetical protein
MFPVGNIRQPRAVELAGPPHPSPLKGLPAQPVAANTNTWEAAGAPLRAFLAARKNEGGHPMRSGRPPEAVPAERRPDPTKDHLTSAKQRTPANDDDGSAP